MRPNWSKKKEKAVSISTYSSRGVATESSETTNTEASHVSVNGDTILGGPHRKGMCDKRASAAELLIGYAARARCFRRRSELDIFVHGRRDCFSRRPGDTTRALYVRNLVVSIYWKFIDTCCIFMLSAYIMWRRREGPKYIVEHQWRSADGHPGVHTTT